MKSATDKLIFGYWAVRGRSGMIRNLLAYCEVPYEERSYKEPADWFQGDKFKLGLTYPNIPYIIDGETKMTGSIAILHYIAMKANRRDLIGDTDEKKIRIFEAMNAREDLRDALRTLVWTKGDFEAEKEGLFSKGKAKLLLSQFNDVLKDRDWLVGSLSISDFALCDNLDMVYEMDKAKLEVYPNLVKYRERFLAIPQIKNLQESDRFFKNWYKKNTATWNNV